MTTEFTDLHQSRVDFLLYEWELIEEFAETLATIESSQEIEFFAENYNWDDGIEPLKLVLDHPLCDFGTALKIYWLGQPDYYAGFATENNIPLCNRDVYLFLKFVESLIINNSFQYNNIQFDPIANYPIEQRHYIAKYADISEELLLPNYGNVIKNRAKLKSYREQPDDAETLDFLTHKYLKSRDLVRALECAERLLVFDSKLQRNWYIKISVLKEIENSYKLQNIETQENIVGDRNIHQLRQELAECYQKAIQLYQNDLDNSNSARFIEKRIIETQESLVDVYLRDRNYERAIENLNTIMEKVKTNPILEVDLQSIALRIAKAYEEVQDYDRALYYLDLFLEEVPEFDYLYFHKLIIFRSMGRQEEADNLLSRMIKTLDNTIASMKHQGLLEASYFYQKSTLLEEYKQDFQAAAKCLQAIIDLELYYNNEDRLKELLLKIEALRTKSVS